MPKPNGFACAAAQWEGFAELLIHFCRVPKTAPRRLMARYYRAPDGSIPVDEFIEALQDVSHQLALDRHIDLINSLDEEHPNLAYPHSSQIEGELRELRCQKGKARYRILYRRSDYFVVLLHIFRKNTDEVPESEKVVARARWDDFRARIDAYPREVPSPIGKRAPSKDRNP